MTEKLLPCPFCGSNKLESGGDDKFVGVRCLTCEATGPNHYRTGSDWGIRTPAPALNTPLCQCENPAIECGATGCRCRLCGEPARMVGMDWKLSDDAKSRIAENEACIVKPGDPRLDQIVGGPQPPRSAASSATVFPQDMLVAWIAFAANGNIRFWTSDGDRAGREKARGMDLRGFTLAELVALASKSAPAFQGSLSSGESDLAVTLDCAGAGTTSPEPDAVREIETAARVLWKLKGGEDAQFDNHLAIKDVPGRFQYEPFVACFTEAKAVLAALSRPAHGGWEEVAREALERIVDHDPDRPGLRYDSERQLIDSMVETARDALARKERGTP